GTIAGLDDGDTIEFTDAIVTAATAAGNVVSVTFADGTSHTYNLADQLPAGDLFSIELDGKGGTDLVVTSTDEITLSYSLVDAGGNAVQTFTTANGGTVTMGLNGSYTYTPAANFFGDDSFTFRAYDGVLASEDQVITIHVNPIAPIAQNGSVSGNE